ncbi:MAG: hypothetical protein HKN33_09345 [Pyrinomonadaceae bacterium]|nr:hypothetical protein [Pyrinomonadaceae bacterium]
MSSNFEVSFNSPQCGWMSVGFEHDGAEFHTTTAHAPHKTALSDMLNTVSGMLCTEGDYTRELKWNRDPEEYDFAFTRTGDIATIEITEYPTSSRKHGEVVYHFEGDPFGIAKAFLTTFQQMFEERDVDEFEENWHQEFPIAELEGLKEAVAGYG